MKNKYIEILHEQFDFLKINGNNDEKSFYK